ncbi:MAG: 50S ribosomal protein L25 [Phycisphaerales bacterium]|nr:50S ribosomal protein L25 [Phycisphaerales bacterium]
MSTQTPTIEVSTRERTGSRHAARLRQSGRLPAVIYGNGDPEHVHVDEKTVLGVLQGGAHVIEVKVDEKSAETCLVRDLQFGWMGDDLIHLDLTRVNLDQEVNVNVSVTLTGDCKAASGEGAVLEVIRTEIEVRCKVRDIPHGIKADISDLQEALTIGELDLPEGVEAVLPPEKHICHITMVAAEPDAEATDVDADGAEPEVIQKEAEEGSSEG